MGCGENFKTRWSADGSYEYTGIAARGAAESDALWRIIRDDGNGNIDWAEGSDNFDKIWDNRTAYSFD